MSRHWSPATVWQWAMWAAVACSAALPWLLEAAPGEAPALWWASRAFGFVSYLALWLAMLTGVLVSAQGLGGWLDRRRLVELHEQLTVAGVLATAVHVLAVVTNEHARIGPISALVPFASERLTASVALGTIAFWTFALVAGSSWMRTRLPHRFWRGVHALAFGAFLLALAHSVAAGSDSAATPARWLYVLSGSILSGAVVTRVAIASTKAVRTHSRNPRSMVRE
jgi:predicted ferric reductase